MSNVIDNPQVIKIGSATVPLKNVSYLGRCYDLKSLDPVDLSKAPGTKVKQAFVLDVTNATPDQGNLIPVGTDYAPGSGGKTDTETATLFTSRDFQSRFAQTVSVEMGVAGYGSFSASTTYERFQREVTTHKKLFTFTESVVRDFTLELVLQDYHNDDLNLVSGLDELVDRVNALPAPSGPVDAEAFFGVKANADAYDDFIRDFGTHFAKRVLFGGRAQQTIEMELDTYTKMERESIQVQAEAKSSFMVDAGVSSSTESEQTQEFRRETEQGRDTIIYSGGTVNSDLNAWASTVRDDPAPVQMKLEPLYELFRASNFPSASHIDAKQALMKNRVEGYLAPRSSVPPARASLGIRVATSYSKGWDDKGSSNGDKDGRWWQADDLPPGYFTVGELGERGYHSSPHRSLLIIRDIEDSNDRPDGKPALAKPTKLEKIWDDEGSGADHDGSFWRPVPPAGYVALGVVSRRHHHHGAPDVPELRCVREDLVTAGKAGDWIWDDKDSGADDHFSSWQIVPADEQEGFALGACFAWGHRHEPGPDDDVALHVLRADVVALERQ